MINSIQRLGDFIAAVDATVFNRTGGTVSIGDWPPTDQAHTVYAELHAAIREQLAAWAVIREAGLDGFNARVAELAVPAIRLEDAGD